MDEELEAFLKLPKAIQLQVWADLKAGVIELKDIGLYGLVDAINYCDSPIEQILYVMLNRWIFENEVDNCEISPQYDIETKNKVYRADFLLSMFDYREEKGQIVEYVSDLVIECDGHAFHEKTKEQVKRRNQRDYDIKMEGYEIIHFSGSEIYNDPISCIDKIIALSNMNYKKTQ